MYVSGTRGGTHSFQRERTAAARTTTRLPGVRWNGIVTPRPRIFFKFFLGEHEEATG